jgi:transposase-like protein
MVAAALCQAFIQPDRAQASATLRHVADQLREKWPKLAAFQRRQRGRRLVLHGFPRTAQNQASLDEP